MSQDFVPRRANSQWQRFAPGANHFLPSGRFAPILGVYFADELLRPQTPDPSLHHIVALSALLGLFSFF